MSNKTNSGRKPKPVLKIAIDAGSISAPPARRGGIARICRTLVKHLPRLDRRNKYLIYTYNKIELDLPASSKESVMLRVLPRLGFGRIFLPLALMLDRPDVFLAVSQFFPAASPTTLGFVYDLAFLSPKFQTSKTSSLKYNTEILVNQAKHLITTSESSKKVIFKKYRLDQYKISVVTPGVDPLFLSTGAKILSDKPYFLYVGALKPNKNVPLILKAFSTFLKNTNSGFRFIIVGEMEGDNKVKQTLEQLSLEKYVTLTGFINDTELVKYYRGAFAFVSPALIEGFGFPLLEAMACGIPVIAGNNSAMKEVMGKAGLLVDAASVTEIAAAMKKLATDMTYYNKLSRLGRKNAGKYHEQKFAKKVLQIINKKVL